MSSPGPVGSLFAICIDVQDLDRSAEFWTAFLGLKAGNRHGNYLEFERRDGEPLILLQRVPEKKTSKTRVHLDIGVDDMEAAVVRAEGLGATKGDAFTEDGFRVVVMEDPDLNEFCLVMELGAADG
jgi:catechol 2,3-dioxygenase-like lactoylglutathione lyase family enzyme